MASLGHIAVGMAAARLYVGSLPQDRRPSLPAAMVALAAWSLAPDLDAVGFLLGVPYGAPFGHRGASHALAAALAAGALSGLVARIRGLPMLRTGGVVGLVVASHGLLDALTDGGRGVALLWPWSTERLFAPWRPIPVAPIGLAIFSDRGLRVMATELVLFLPCWLIALWPRSSAPQNRTS